MASRDGFAKWKVVDLVAEDPYRYYLRWTRGDAVSQRRLVVIGLNPSDAGQPFDKDRSDTTLRNVKQWAEGRHKKTLRDPTRSQFSDITIVNLFAWRNGDAKLLDEEISTNGSAIGPTNRDALLTASTDATATVVAGWGGATNVKKNHGTFVHQRDHVLGLLQCDLYRVGEIQGGNPQHPYCWNFDGCDGRLYPWRIDGAYV